MRIQNPLSGWPKTKPLRGKEGYRVVARYLTPVGARIIDTITVLGTLVLMGWVFMLYARAGNAVGGVLVAAVVIMAASGLAAAGLFRWLGQWIVGAKTVIEFQPNLLRIRGALGFKNYDRLLPHAFEYDIHEKAQDEEERERAAKEQAMRRRKQKLPKSEKYYRKSFEVILRYAGSRVDIAAVFGKKKADALLARLQLLDAMMDAARGSLTEPSRSDPAKQYGVRPEAQ